MLARANAIVNQLYVVNVNAADPAGLGRSIVVDPEGIVRVEAGEGEELVTDVIDLDAVTRVREARPRGCLAHVGAADAGGARRSSCPSTPDASSRRPATRAATSVAPLDASPDPRPLALTPFER